MFNKKIRSINNKTIIYILLNTRFYLLESTAAMKYYYCWEWTRTIRIKFFMINFFCLGAASKN